MPYDPNFPPRRQALASTPWRNQFNGLADLIAQGDAESAQNVAGVAPAQFFEGDDADGKAQRIADAFNQLLAALARNDAPAAVRSDNQTLAWTVANQPAQFLIEQCNNGTGAPVPDSSTLIAGDQRSYASIGELWARVTSADADGNPVSPRSAWVYFEEIE